MPELIENQEDVRVTVAEFIGFKSTHVGKSSNLKDVQHKINDVRHITLNNPRALIATDFNYIYTYIGSWALKLLGEKFKIEPFCQMLVDKNKMYGPGPILGWGNLGVIIRIHSKIERFINLKDKDETEQGNESLFDTLSDVVGYCVLGIKYDERFKGEAL